MANGPPSDELSRHLRSVWNLEVMSRGLALELHFETADAKLRIAVVRESDGLRLEVAVNRSQLVDELVATVDLAMTQLLKEVDRHPTGGPIREERPEIPDLIQPVIGFRSWQLRGPNPNLDEPALLSTGIGQLAWEPGVNEARCKTVEAHDAPVEGCGCGLYALHGTEDLSAGPGLGVAGAVALWGKLEVHPAGIRAEKALVVALTVFDYGGYAQATGDFSDVLRRLSERYGAPLVAPWDLREEGLKHGIACPEAMIPDDERTAPLSHGAWQIATGSSHHTHLHVSGAPGIASTAAGGVSSMTVKQAAQAMQRVGMSPSQIRSWLANAGLGGP